jgi:hypothetical protein
MSRKWCPVARSLAATHDSRNVLLWKHVAECDECRKELAVIDKIGGLNLEDNFEKKAECLDDKTLSAYLAKTLKTSEHKKVKDHIERCARCMDAAILMRRKQMGREKDDVETMVKEALDLLPLRDVIVEYSAKNASVPAEWRQDWVPVNPVIVQWVERGVLARFLLGTGEDGTYRVSFGKEWTEHIELPVRQRLKAAAASKGPADRLGWKYDNEEGSHVLLVRFDRDLLKGKGE